MYNNPMNSDTWSIRSATCCGSCCIYVTPTNCDLQVNRPTKHIISHFSYSCLTLTAAAHVSFLGCPVEIFDGQSGRFLSEYFSSLFSYYLKQLLH